MKAILCALTLSALAAVSHAAEAPAPAATPAPKPSAFNIDENARNPFWPIGWHPSGSGSGGVEAASEIPPTAFNVSSIVIGTNTKFAIVNGKTMQEGQRFGLQMGSQVYQVTLKAIQDGRIILQSNKEEIVVPLRRR